VSGEGLDITCAADGILISPTYTVSSEEQFIRRMLRSGQKLPVRLQVLSFSDSIEEGIASYSTRKHRAVAAVMDGRPLNKREKAILEDDFASMKRHGPIAYESLTPRQQALWILSRLKGLGKDGIRAFLYADDGKYAKEFARAYPVDEETSLSGNTARLVAAVIERLESGASSPKIIADIACGCRTLERMFEGSRALSVKSVDINEVALSAGAGLLKTPKETRQDEVRTMDDLPFNDGSIDIGVISLALHMTQHSFNSKREKTGQERIRTLLEINRTLKNGGTAILSFPESLFPSETDFTRFVSTIEHHFGFRRVDGLTGLVKGLNGAESEHYASWIVVLEK
jgi:SAM-dependent methyltransferase